MGHRSNIYLAWASALAALLLLTTVLPLRAQTVNSLVEGVIQDASGAVVPGAQLSLTNVNTEVAQTTASNSALPCGVMSSYEGLSSGNSARRAGAMNPPAIRAPLG